MEWCPLVQFLLDWNSHLVKEPLEAVLPVVLFEKFEDVLHTCGLESEVFVDNDLYERQRGGD